MEEEEGAEEAEVEEEVARADHRRSLTLPHHRIRPLRRGLRRRTRRRVLVDQAVQVVQEHQAGQEGQAGQAGREQEPGQGQAAVRQVVADQVSCLS